MKTFQSCGSSSSDVRRRNLPTFVMRGSSFILKMTPSFDSFWAASDSLSASASCRMLRNLWNLKCRPLQPTRTCEKKTGPGLERFTAIAIARNTGESSTIPTPLPTMSIARLSA